MKYVILIALLFTLGASPAFCKVPVILHDKDAQGTTLLAVKELQRYLYLRTGEMPQIKPISGKESLSANSIFIATVNSLKKYNINQQLAGESYKLLSTPNKGLLIIGGSEIATLYGAYKFLESTGIGFALDEDIIPERKLTAVALSGFNKTYEPSFALRGIQPFHDFPEGPDWWNEDDYEAIISQLPKMGMNFIGFHTYPYRKFFRGWFKAEPLVWIGTKDQFDETGKVNAGYPVLHSNTNDSTWNYYPKATTDFNFGAAQLFETANYGADYMKNVSAWPHTEQENIDIFNKMGQLLHNSFTLARDLGVKTCIGTETALSVPFEVKDKFIAENKDPQSDAAKQEVYEGIFSRIKATHPLDYYWFWTSEDWTWEGEAPGEVDRARKDLLSAVAAAKKVDAPFTLATCGWVLGPARNRAEFDELLPKEMPFGVINRQQGYTVVEPAFENVHGRPKWEITWMEDDPAMITPQFWAGRTRKDAQDAYKYGCTGLMGIHWRTRSLSSSFMALARAGWEARDYKKVVPADTRDYPAGDLYDEWALLQFGAAAAKQASAVFQQLDGAPLYVKGKNEIVGNFPRTSIWGEQGPGMIIVNKKPWKEVEKEYNFIRAYEKCGPLVKEAAHQDRYKYWLHTFYYAKALAQVGCALGQMDTIATLTGKATDAAAKKALGNQLLTARNNTVRAWGEMVTHLLQTVNTTGEMGTIANIEQHNMQQMRFLVKYDSLINAAVGENIPAADLSKSYTGDSRLVVTTKRTLLHHGEDLNMRIRILTSSNIVAATVFWKPLGAKSFEQKAIDHEASNVYQLHLSEDEFKQQDLEYYVVVKLASGENLKYPVGENTTQSVVVW
jgi:hypothetical protein